MADNRKQELLAQIMKIDAQRQELKTRAKELRAELDEIIDLEEAERVAATLNNEQKQKLLQVLQVTSVKSEEEFGVVGAKQG